MSLKGQPLLAGSAFGRVLNLDEPISFWGGIDPADGRIVDHHHPQAGRSVTGRILVLPHGRGSSSSPSVVAEMIRRGTAPSGIVLGGADPMVVLGALVAAELYDVTLPIVALTHPALADAREVEIQADGHVKIR